MNTPLTTITDIAGNVMEQEIALVRTKGRRPVPIGKTGYFRSRRLADVQLSAWSKPKPTAVYLVMDASGKVLDRFLTALRANAYAKQLASANE